MNSVLHALRQRRLLLGLVLFIGLAARGAFAASAPNVETQPQSQSVLVNSNATLSVIANGTAPLAYRWFLNRTNALTNSATISGATTSILTVKAAVGVAPSPGVAIVLGPYSAVVSN